MNYISNIILLLGLPFFASAQFHGGNGDGTSSGYFHGTLSGEVPVIFASSIGDGHDFGFGAALVMEAGCDLNISISSAVIPAGVYTAENQITASGAVSLGEVAFHAGSEVLLIPNFEVGPSQMFTIDILSCVAAPASSSDFNH